MHYFGPVIAHLHHIPASNALDKSSSPKPCLSCRAQLLSSSQVSRAKKGSSISDPAMQARYGSFATIHLAPLGTSPRRFSPWPANLAAVWRGPLSSRPPGAYQGSKLVSYIYSSIPSCPLGFFTGLIRMPNVVTILSFQPSSPMSAFPF